MGVNITIDCDGWDKHANGGMKEILWNNEKFPKVYFSAHDDLVDGFRPADFALWRKSILELNCNVEMWMKGLDSLEKNLDLKASYSA